MGKYFNDKEITSKLEKYLTPRMKEILTKEVLPSYAGKDKFFADAIKRKKGYVLINVTNLSQLIKSISNSPKDLVVMLSYCIKPIECPSGRFSDKCRPRLSSRVCEKCPLKDIKFKTNKIGCDFYIDYKTKEMVKDYLIPTFREFQQTSKFKPLIVVSCPMGLNRFLEAAIIIGFKGIGFYLTKGICKTAEHYKKGDTSKKKEITDMEREMWEKINYILDKFLKKKD